jgi:hypothetical protein
MSVIGHLIRDQYGRIGIVVPTAWAELSFAVSDFLPSWSSESAG